MTGPLHVDRARALSFGGVAEAYDRARPSYPDALIDDLMALGPRDVLDVGTGTGKAARLLAARGCTVLGVEPDARMAAVARAHGISVEEAPFETWDDAGRTFGLLTSGQAWHWVDPEAGVAKAARVIRAGGHLAAFWNLGKHDPEVAAALRAVYQRLVPEIAAETTALGCQPGEHRWRADPLRQSPAVAAVETRSYSWDTVYTRAAWLDYLATHSDHVRLEQERRDPLFAAVGDAIDGFGGSIPFHFRTTLILATLRAQSGDAPYHQSGGDQGRAPAIDQPGDG